MELPEETTVTFEEAVSQTEAIFRTTAMGAFALSSVPALVRKFRSLDTDQVQWLADFLYGIAPIRATEFAKQLAGAWEVDPDRPDDTLEFRSLAELVGLDRGGADVGAGS